MSSIKCSNCGLVGHNKRNPSCPVNRADVANPPTQWAVAIRKMSNHLDGQEARRRTRKPVKNHPEVISTENKKSGAELAKEIVIAVECTDDEIIFGKKEEDTCASCYIYVGTLVSNCGHIFCGQCVVDQLESAKDTCLRPCCPLSSCRASFTRIVSSYPATLAALSNHIETM